MKMWEDSAGFVWEEQQPGFLTVSWDDTGSLIMGACFPREFEEVRRTFGPLKEVGFE